MKHITSMTISFPDGSRLKFRIPAYYTHTLVLGSGAAGLNSALQLYRNGIEDIVIVTEGLKKGTSINTGSDKQTYYKLGINGDAPDSPYSMARALYNGGSMHGDIALIEAANSLRAFFNLVNLGVPFPTDIYGQFAGYKTDHDPAQRATSAGPYTSKFMCKALIAELKKCKIKIDENRIAVSLIINRDVNSGEQRAAGIITANKRAASLEEIFEIYLVENVVFAVGGPGGLYKRSVYPVVHTGAIGLALMEGAAAYNLQEFQFGIASLNPRRNVSGSYMQVIPKFISTDSDGTSNPCEFLLQYFDSPEKMHSAIFLKGYQWPFDTKKIIAETDSPGSSIIDILVYMETVEKGRRVFLDFTENGYGFNMDILAPEAREYLKNCNISGGKPIDRLKQMNPDAIAFYRDHSIDIAAQPLEIAVCAQHNNGGLAADIWWESINIKRLFPAGEVNGTHGVYRQGGSALNSGQVAGFRIAERIADCYKERSLNIDEAFLNAEKKLKELISMVFKGKTDANNNTWRCERKEMQGIMSKSGAHIRSKYNINEAIEDAIARFRRLSSNFMKWTNITELTECLRNIQLCFSQIVYLDTIKFFIDSGVGSRGSALVYDEEKGIRIHQKLPDKWKMQPEDISFREKILYTEVLFTPESGNIKTVHKWIKRNEVPKNENWFENVWKDYKQRKKSVL